jgi:hypothetical protein
MLLMLGRCKIKIPGLVNNDPEFVLSFNATGLHTQMCINTVLFANHAAGDMIAMPFGLWLISSLLDFTSIGALYALCAITGIVLVLYTEPSNRYYLLRSIVAFSLMCSPLVWRLVSVPLWMFHYLGFEIPVALFAVLFILSVAFGLRERRRQLNLNKLTA